MKVITYQAPTSKAKIRICPSCKKRLTGSWPKDHRGEDYVDVYKGLTYGNCDTHRMS